VTLLPVLTIPSRSLPAAYACKVCHKCARHEATHRSTDLFEMELHFRKGQLKSIERSRAEAKARVASAEAAVAAALRGDAGADVSVFALQQTLVRETKRESALEDEYDKADEADTFWRTAVRFVKAPRIALDLEADEARGECPRCGTQLGAVPKPKAGEQEEAAEESPAEESAAEEEEEEDAAAAPAALPALPAAAVVPGGVAAMDEDT
jgi:hypothetical protein